MQRRTLLLAAAAGGVAVGARAQAEDATLRERLRHEGIGLVAAVVDGSSVRFAAAGRRAIALDTPPDADTRFEYGSITKTFTALLLADASLRDGLKLDDAVEAVLPDGLKLRDRAGSAITWADLATHASGLPRLPDNMKDPAGADPYDYDRAAMWDFVARWRPERVRGERFEYSNLGFGLLGEALALRAATSYDALLRERVLEPLGLGEMQLALRSRSIAGLAPGHGPGGAPVPNWRFDAMAGAGALVGSARSLARYAQAAMGVFEHPLTDAFRLALTPRRGSAQGVALGWLFGPAFGRRVFNHDGATGGYASALFLDPERRRAALVLANAQVGVTDLALHLQDARAPLRDFSAEKQVLAREAVAVADEAMAVLPGVYALNPQFKVSVRFRAGRLFAQASGQGEFELFALEARRWFARVTPLEIAFEGESGPPPAFVLTQGGQRLRFVRE